MNKEQLTIDNGQLPEGYKQTEVGVIPEEWSVKALGEICIRIQDGNYGGDYPKSHEFLSYGIPFLTSKVLGKDGSLKEERIDFISYEKHAQLDKAHLQLNDVLFTNRGASVGAIGFVDERISNGNIGPQLTLLRADEKVILSLFLYYIMKSATVTKQILGQDSGSAMNFFSIGATEKFKVPLPSNREEQRSIAQALSDVDRLIAALEKAIAKKRAIKTATMQQLLTGKTRLPGFGEGKGYKESEVGVIPEDWDVLTLGEITSFVGSGKSVVKRDTGDYPLYGSTGVIGYSQTFEYEGNSILVARVGANAGRLNFVSGCYGVSDNTIIIKLKNESNIHFFLFQLWSKDLNSLVFGSGQPLITGTQIKNLSVVRPSVTEQNEIATVLSDMGAEIAALEFRLAKTQSIKQGMMQELLTGRTRLV